MIEETSLLLQEYYKSNRFSRTMYAPSASYSLGNSICGDTIEVFLRIEDDCVTDYSYQGQPSPITKAAAEFVGDYIIGASLDDILKRDAEWVRTEGFEVSFRRVRSSISAILASRNAIHQYRSDGLRDEYEDLID